MDLFDPAGSIEIVIAAGLRVRWAGSDVLPAELEALREAFQARFVRDNPVYGDARRYRRPCRHIPRQIALFEVDPATGDWILPRGAIRDVVSIIEKNLPGRCIDIIDRTVAPARLGLSLACGLRDYQSRAVESALRAGQGVIQSPTGSGKTVMACGLIAETGVSTLIVVHTSVLLEQTAAAVRQFLGVDPGIIGGGVDAPGSVTVAMVQTLARRDAAALHGRFGMVILDEAHHCPAESFKTIVAGFPARYRFGLTATPARKDRLHPVLYDVLGPIVARVDARNLMASGNITPVEMVRIDTGFKTRYVKDYPRLVTRIAKNPARNAVVVDAVRRHRGDRTLVLSERVDHCSVLAAGLTSAGVDCRVMTGAAGRDERSALLQGFSRGDFTVLVSTSSLVGEGFDLPAIDTVVITIPNGNVARTTQFLGRALRPSAGKTAGRIVDFCDIQVSLLFNQFQKRAAVYRKFAIREIVENLPDGVTD